MTHIYSPLCISLGPARHSPQFSLHFEQSIKALTSI